MKFPKDFIWGAAASSYQIEGAAWREGGGHSIWDMMGRHAGKIVGGDTGEIACDHFHRYREDINLMSDIGLQAYRFSVSWPRVLPDGVGAINQKGLDFYSNLVDRLLEKNITPWVTLFHWDFPYELYCRGGWLNRDSADWFADYTAIIVDSLSDRVSNWCTLNEPQVYIGLGHHQGTHAPGLEMGVGEALRAGHHTLLAHGKAVQVIRARAKKDPFISASHAGNFFMPGQGTSRSSIRISLTTPGFRTRWCLDIIPRMDWNYSAPTCPKFNRVISARFVSRWTTLAQTSTGVVMYALTTNPGLK
jgi:beta-glucosidase